MTKPLPVESLAKSAKRKQSDIGEDDEVEELNKAWFKTTKFEAPALRQSISLRLNSEVLTWYRSQGKGY